MERIFDKDAQEFPEQSAITTTTICIDQCCQCSDFDKITTEIDILINIFTLMKFSDQMSLARVNRLLCDVFKTYIWKVTYTSMKILQNTNGHVLVLSGSEDPRWLYLDSKEFEEFLEIYSNDVEELVANQEAIKFIHMPNNPHCDLDIESEVDGREVELQFRKQQSDSFFRTWCYMKNLKSLSIGGKFIDKRNFEFISQHLPHLWHLELKLDVEKCQGFEDTYTCGQALMQMTNLKSFAITVNSPIVLTISYRIYRDLLVTLGLESLKLDMSLQHQKKFNALQDEQQSGNTLRHLKIVITADEHNHSTVIIESCFLNCEQLKHLELQLQDLTFNEETCNIIVKRCQNLDILHLVRTNISCQYLKMPEKLKELSLEECVGLTYDNLRQILRFENLKKFSSIKTLFTGQHVDVIANGSLENLKCDSANTRRFLRGFGMPHLNELLWHDPFNTASEFEGLLACPLIEKLSIVCDPLPLQILQQLPNLKKLRLHHVYALNWIYVEGLLKNLSLDELIINQFYGAEVLNTPLEGFPTIVKILRINMNMIVHADFWLDLFCQNPKLTLIFFGRLGPFHLKRILLKSRFPKDLRTIEFSGISINCNGLRRDFNETISTIPFLKDYKSENYIKLCR